jgi:hypothetical protein
MDNKSLTQAKGKKSDNLQNLMKEAAKAGILHVSAHGKGVSEDILKDAIETTKILDKCFPEHT